MKSGTWLALLGLAAGFAPTALAAAPSTPPDPAKTVAASKGGGDGVAPEASAATEPVVPETAADAEEAPKPKPGLGGNFIFDNSLGNGTFVSNPYANNPAWSTNLYLRPDYSFKLLGQNLKIQAWENLTYYTILDKNALDNRQVDWSDLRLTVSDANIYEEPHTHIKIGAMIRGTVPLSYQSRFDGMVTALWAGVTVSKSLFGIDLMGGVLGAKNFFRYTTAQFPCTAGGQEPVAVAPGDTPTGGFLNALTNGDCAAGGSGAANSTAITDNVSWNLVPWFSAQYNFSEKWNLSLTVYYFDQFFFPVPVDQNSSGIGDANGHQVAQVNGRTDSLWTIASLQYNLTDHWALATGLWDVSLPMTPDNRGLNPVFYDFLGPNQNDTTIYFDLIANY